MLPNLEPLLEGKRLVAAEEARVQFEVLLEMHGGSLELARWQALVPRIEFIGGSDEKPVLGLRGSEAEAGEAGTGAEEGSRDDEGSWKGGEGVLRGGEGRGDSEGAATGAVLDARSSPEPGGGGGGGVDRDGVYWEGCSRVEGLEGLTPMQKKVLLVGDYAKAVTMTANGRAVRSAAQQGVELEAYVHRAVWLTGL